MASPAATRTCGQSVVPVPIPIGWDVGTPTRCLAVRLGRALAQRLRYRRCRLDSPSNLAGRSCANLSRFPADNPAHRRIVAQALGVVDVLIPSETTEHGLS